MPSGMVLTFDLVDQSSGKLQHKSNYLKGPQIIETRALHRVRNICYAFITAKTQVEIYFVQLLNYS